MRMFDVQGIEITAPRRKVFEFLREPANLPRWAHAFVEGALDAQRALLQSELATLKSLMER